jgi:hypothetical protein
MRYMSCYRVATSSCLGETIRLKTRRCPPERTKKHMLVNQLSSKRNAKKYMYSPSKAITGIIVVILWG